MFWNSEFLDSTPSHIDVLLQMQTVKLSDILFEEDLLQELKTSNVSLANYLNRPEIIAELIENITQLTEKDCSDKLLYSRVHAAYISCEIVTAGPSEILATLMNDTESLKKIISCLTINDCTLDPTEVTTTKVVPQKATLVSKLISTIHSSAPANLSCHITQDIASFSKLINLLVQNIDISGSFEILSTFIKRTAPELPELRYVFCEILSKLNFVYSLIDVMTLSDIEDKQRNACQLLCDIIVIGRQDASEQTDSGPMAQDMLAELLESTQAVHVILNQMFSENMRNTTAIVCGMKVLQTLLEQKSTSVAKTIEKTQEEIEKHLIKFHELLLNPPKQEPIKTTFGIIQKPLGYMRLEVVNLIRALISTNSPIIIRRLVELKTMKIIIDLFIDYSWNNLLHTQVEQALCLIINNYRRDEELNYQIDMQHHTIHHPPPPTEATDSGVEPQENHQPKQDELSNQEQTDQEGENAENREKGEQEEQQLQEQQIQEEEEPQQLQSQQQPQENNQEKQEQPEQEQEEQSAKEIPSRALLSQLLNECDLIGRLLLPSNSNMTSSNNDVSSLPVIKVDQRKANSGHIIQMINSIAINRDLDTIRDHLNEMEDKKPELYDRWTTFVNVDVASFKEISLYYDAQSANNNVNHRYGHTQHLLNSSNPSHLNSTSSDNVSSPNSNGDDQFLAYFSFTRETVIPAINVDVLPRLRRSKNAH